MHELLTIKQMYQADEHAIASGISGIELMENAGAAIAETVVENWPQAHEIIVLCGPGNNGGDGFVAARLLAEQGCLVRLIDIAANTRRKGDAAIAAERHNGDVEGFSAEGLTSADLIIDALFGAGLSRDLKGQTADLIDAVNASDAPVLSVDMPSGIDGNTGAVRGCAITADMTVTFFRRKPGHLLMPGRQHCGTLQVADIGIISNVLKTINPTIFANEPGVWRDRLPASNPNQHKYTRGHVLAVTGGPGKTGAGRLAARGALRAGAGLVSVATSPDALAENAAHLTAIMIKVFDGGRQLKQLLTDKRLNSVVIGPALGSGADARASIETVLQTGAQTVIDADGLTCFTETPEIGQGAGKLFSAIQSNSIREVVLTPHHGEFERLFGKLEGSKLDRAKAAADKSGAIVVYKGPDTIIAAPGPDNQLAINANAPASLATAGSGDVLAGIIAGLMAQGMSGFDAACAGVWMHGEAANLFGPGLIAEDLPEMLPKVLSQLQ